MTVFFLRILFLPILIPKYILKHPRTIILIAAVFFVFVAARACNNYLNPALNVLTIEVPKYQSQFQPLVDTNKVNKVVVSTSRIYPASEVILKTTDEGVILKATLINYYSYDGKRWLKEAGPLPLDRKYYGEIKVYELTD